MTDLTTTAAWTAGVYQLEEDDLVLGGATGASNKPGLDLANRTDWLKDKMDAAMPNRVITAVSANYTVLATDHTIHVTTAGSDRTLTLPAASSVPTMRSYRIKKIDAGVGKVLFTADGRTCEISRQNDCVWIQSNGTTWETVVARAHHRTRTQAITTTGAFSFAVPADVQEVMVTLQGAGGAGGPHGENAIGGSGGGSGARVGPIAYAVVPGGTVSGIVGAGGALTYDGADTTFGTLTAGGGKKGTAGYPGAGGTATVNGIAHRGTPGGYSYSVSNTSIAGNGGGEGGGRGGSETLGAAEAGVSGGGGGGGGGETAQAAGVGGDGWVLVEWLEP